VVNRVLINRTLRLTLLMCASLFLFTGCTVINTARHGLTFVFVAGIIILVLGRVTTMARKAKIKSDTSVAKYKTRKTKNLKVDTNKTMEQVDNVADKSKMRHFND